MLALHWGNSHAPSFRRVQSLHLHVLLAPVRGRVFPLAAYSGTAKLNGLFNGPNRPYTGNVAINALNG